MVVWHVTPYKFIDCSDVSQIAAASIFKAAQEQTDVHIYKFYMPYTVHHMTVNWRKITNKCTEIVNLFLKFIYSSHRHVSVNIP